MPPSTSVIVWSSANVTSSVFTVTVDVPPASAITAALNSTVSASSSSSVIVILCTTTLSVPAPCRALISIVSPSSSYVSCTAVTVVVS